jgi:hypothetical protein
MTNSCRNYDRSPTYFMPPAWCGNFRTKSSQFGYHFAPIQWNCGDWSILKNLVALTVWCTVQWNPWGFYRQVQRIAKDKMERRRKWRRNLLKTIFFRYSISFLLTLPHLFSFISPRHKHPPSCILTSNKLLFGIMSISQDTCEVMIFSHSL